MAVQTAPPRRPSTLRAVPDRHVVVQELRRGPVLTLEGRAQLELRVTRLRDEVLPAMRPLLAEADRDERVVADFERAIVEMEELEHLLAEAGTLEPAPAGCSEVRLGVAVVVEFPDGERVRLRVVDPAEAFLDDERVSATSPIARAVLGAPVGATVEVDAPNGRWAARVIAIETGGPEPTGHSVAA